MRSCSGKKFTMRGALYAWDGKVFRQDSIPVEIAKFKVRRWCVVICVARFEFCDLGLEEDGPDCDPGHV